MRRWLACGLVGFWCLALSLSACGSDSSPPASPTPDAATPTPTTTATTPTPTTTATTPPAPIAVSLPDVSAYTGSTVTVDGSSVNATGFTWTVQSAPQGSAVATATLQGASTA